MFDTIVQRGVLYLLIAIIGYLLIRLLFFRQKKGAINGVDRESFELKMYSMNEHCSEYTLKEFMKFLDKYKGGRVQKQHGHIVAQEFTIREKGELKSLFYDVVAPAKDVSIATKEQFRNYIKNIKVDGVDMRPRYEDYTRRMTDKDAEDDKVVSYFADYEEDKILDCLKRGLDTNKYTVLDNVAMKEGEETRYFGHIVIGDSGAFILESEASADLIEQKRIIESIGNDLFLEVHPVVVLTDNSSSVKQEEDLPYKVLATKNLCNYIREYPDNLPINERMMLVSRLNELSTN